MIDLGAWVRRKFWRGQTDPRRVEATQSGNEPSQTLKDPARTRLKSVTDFNWTRAATLLPTWLPPGVFPTLSFGKTSQNN